MMRTDSSVAAASQHRTSSRVGLVARSPEGHAAKTMQIKGHEDQWVDIQAHTFRNWVNEHLRPPTARVEDLATDLKDGRVLCELVEDLQGRKIVPAWSRGPPGNRHQMLENVSKALAAVADDGVKLVNIGNEDIVNGNLKLILGLIWSLIVRYQIGRSKFPPKKLMLAWLKSVLPECRVNNFTTDWNSGICLSSLLDYCEPGLFPHWKNLDPDDCVDNCRRAMELARDRFSIPMVLEPEYLASPYLDELSGMTYLSYFMKDKSPGTKATLNWVNSQLKTHTVSNFTTDWKDGIVLCELTKSLGVPVKYQTYDDPDVWESNLNAGMNAGKKLGVEPLLKAKDVSSLNASHLGMMSYVSNFQWVKPRTRPSHTVRAHSDTHTTRVYKPTSFKVTFLDSEVDPNDVTVEIIGPELNTIPCNLNLKSNGGTCTFVPLIIGMYKITIFNGDEVIQGCPMFIRAMPEVSEIKHSGMEPCAVGSIVEVQINCNGAKAQNIQVLAMSPDGRELECPVTESGDAYRTTFQPDEPGEWTIAVKHRGQLIEGSPYTCFVFDPNGIKLLGLDRTAIAGSIVNWTLDARGTGGLGKIEIDIVHDKQSLPHTIDHIGNSIYNVSLHTRRPGKYKIYVYFNGATVKGSPFPLRVGTKEDIKRHKSITPTKLVNGNNSSAFNEFSSFNENHKIDLLRPISPLQSPKFTSSPINHHSSSSSTVYKSTNLSESGFHSISSPLHLNIPSSLSPNYSYTSPKNALSPSKSKDNDIVFGENMQLMPINRPSTVYINSDEPLANINVTVIGPSSKMIPVRMSRNIAQGHILAQFTAEKIGEHSIDVKINGTKVTGSPFRSHAYDVYAIKVGHIPNGVVGEPVEFEIDGSGAGSGNLEILVNGGHVTSFVRNLGNQKFLASFVPHKALVHLVDMKFNNEQVPGSPWEVTIMSGGSYSPKLSVLGDAVKLIPVDSVAVFQISAIGFHREDVQVNVLSPTKRNVLAKIISEGGNGIFRIEFIVVEVGTHLVDVSVAGHKLGTGTLLAKGYNSALIRVTDVSDAVVGQPCQFRVDASDAGEGQLEISINEGEVPNHVTVVGGGRCLVSFTPEHVKPHMIDIKFNSETVIGCPFVCSVSDTSRVSVNLSRLELIPVNQVAKFHMMVDNSASAELSVSVTGPTAELPVKVTGNVNIGFTAEFTPLQVGAHSISVEYNGHAVNGTPYVAKAYDSSKVLVGHVPKGHVGNTFQFTVDASESGEGNLEITISARGANIPTQVHPQGNAKFAVSFLPFQPTDHVITIHFNKEPVPGSPFIAHVEGDLPLVSGSSLTSAPVSTTSHFTMSNVSGSLDDIEVNVEGPNGSAVPAQVKDSGSQLYKIEFCPKIVGEHKIAVSYLRTPVAGSPFSCKVYDIKAIKVKSVLKGTVGQQVTFIVETSQAGPGNLEVTVNGGRVPTSAQAQGPHTYAISFTPRQPTVHTVHLRFNNHDVPGSPFTCTVSEAARVVVWSATEDKVAVGKVASFAVQCESSPQVQVLAPLRHSLPVTVIPAAQQSNHNVQFTPIDVGDHSVEVKVDGVHVEGSPFLIKAYDASKVRVTDINTGFVGKPVNFNINASEAGAGNLEIIVSVNGVNVPNYVQSEGNAKFRVNFKPRDAAPHSLSVRFNGEPIPGSPLTCRVLDIDQVAVTGTGVRYCAIQKTADIKIESPDISNDTNFKVKVFSPSNQPVDVKTSIMANAIGAYYTPNEIGRHMIEVFIEDQPVEGSPFACNAYNINNIKVTGLDNAKAGKPVTFSVDATEAGEGTLELVVSSQRGTVKAEVVACSRGLYDVTFVPHNAIPHFVNITFNDEIVPGSPYGCDVVDLNGVKKGISGSTITAFGEGLQRVKLGYPARFDINPHIADHGSISVIVKGPDNKTLPVNLHKHDSGLYRVTYRPSIVGIHTVTIMHRNQPITKHPWKVQVIDTELVIVSGLNEAICNKPTSFKVDTRNAGKGELSVSIKAAGREIKLKTSDVESNGIHQVAYQPVIPVPHHINVKYNNFNVDGSPFVVNVREPNPSTSAELRAVGLGLYQGVSNKVCSFIIDSAGKSSHEFDVFITGPQNSVVPVQCYQHKNGMNLIVEYTPPRVGQYNIDVTHVGKHLKGSPFVSYVYDASSVKTDDLPEKNSVVIHKPVSFKLLRKNAGLADFTVTCLGPDNEDVPVNLKYFSEDIDVIQIYPTVPGDFIFNILYGKDHIAESPLKVYVADPGVPRVWGSGLVKALKDVSSTFYVSALGTSYHTVPTVNVRNGAETVPVTINQYSSGHEGDYEVSFTPASVGFCDVNIVWNGRHVGESPYKCMVVDLNKVLTIGETNLNSRLVLGVNAPTTLSFDTSAAGPGELEGRLESQGGMVVPILIDRSGNNVKCVLTPNVSGPHALHLDFAGFPLPSSPYPALVESSAAGVRVVLSGSGLTSAVCGQQAEFTIDGSQAGPGIPVVTLAGSRNEISVNVEKTSDNVYSAVYTPASPGSYLLNVLWGYKQVKGCPLKINVTGVCDAGKVLCTGDGLGIGTVGKDIRSFIDTRRAGPGELSAHCIGPHKVAYCELYDHGDGTFTLNVKPQESGRHTLTVKYAGEDVPGSPFTVRVSGAPDASKVRVYGPGIEHGVLAIFQSRFICDTRGAGAGQLTVRVRGPKGAFRVEMQRENQKDRTILCKFDPTEPGDYRVEVKWAGEHVPGSPFVVMIFDTQEELNRFLQGNHSPASSDLYSSVNYSSSYAHITP